MRKEVSHSGLGLLGIWFCGAQLEGAQHLKGAAVESNGGVIDFHFRKRTQGRLVAWIWKRRLVSLSRQGLT